MTRSRAVANAAGMLFAAQLLVMVVQFGYSAITGRLVSATGFGAYTVAMGLSSLVSLMLSAGLPAFALKEKDLDHGGEASLWTMAWLSGIASGIVVFLTAGLWSTLWAQPEATLITRAFAINAVFAPVVAVQLALGRRRGYVRGDAAVLVISGILGYIVGAVAVYLTGSAVSLVIAPTATSLIAVIVALPMVRPWPRAWPKGWKTAPPKPPPRNTAPPLRHHCLRCPPLPPRKALHCRFMGVLPPVRRSRPFNRAAIRLACRRICFRAGIIMRSKCAVIR